MFEGGFGYFQVFSLSLRFEEVRPEIVKPTGIASGKTQKVRVNEVDLLGLEELDLTESEVDFPA